jgi:putative transposon-encoded protein
MSRKNLETPLKITMLILVMIVVQSSNFYLLYDVYIKIGVSWLYVVLMIAVFTIQGIGATWLSREVKIKFALAQVVTAIGSMASLAVVKYYIGILS